MLETISAREIDRYIFNKNYLLVDVRQPADYRKTHIRGAVCIPSGISSGKGTGTGKNDPDSVL